MSVIYGASGFSFGMVENPPQFEGFVTVAKEGNWLTATRVGKEYIVEEMKDDGDYRLTVITRSGNSVQMTDESVRVKPL